MAFDPRMEKAVNDLVAASGGRIWVVSGYRSEEEQARLWQQALRDYGSEEEARMWVAPPGKSNHGKGIAADLGGDLDLAHELAPRFGLHFPMSWEPWHAELMGSREEGGVDAYTTPPPGHEDHAHEDQAAAPPEIDYGSILSSMIGGPSYTSIFRSDPALTPRDGSMDASTKPVLADERKDAPVYTSASSGGPDGIDNFMRALRDVESSGDYGAIGAPTPWGTAKGAYQFLDSTWGHYEGYATAADAPPEVQDRRARELMQEYYNKFGSWDDVAAAWFSGPGGNWQSAEVREYVGKVKSRL